MRFCNVRMLLPRGCSTATALTLNRALTVGMAAATSAGDRRGAYILHR